MKTLDLQEKGTFFSCVLGESQLLILYKQNYTKISISNCFIHKMETGLKYTTMF